MIHFLCTNCKKALKAPPEAKGKPFKCGGCGTPQAVPGASKLPSPEQETPEPTQPPPAPAFPEIGDQPLPITKPRPTQDAPLPAPVADYSALKNSSQTFGQVLYSLLMSLLAFYAIYCWVNFFAVGLRHAKFLGSQGAITIGESGAGLYQLGVAIIEPLVCTFIFFIIATVVKIFRTK